MSEIFKTLADKNLRNLLETLAEHPASTNKQLQGISSLSVEQFEKAMLQAVEADLVKSVGSGAAKKFSLNAKGFTPVLSWLAKVAETQVVATVEMQLTELGEKLGQVVAEGTEWVEGRVNSKVDIDPKKWGRELGRVLAETKREFETETRQVAKDAEKLISEVKRKVKR
ncbi:MAG: hypothetical protein ACKOXT_02120 [Actinomycetota bacterium]